MEIRCNSKDYGRLKKLYDQNAGKIFHREVVSITMDEKTNIPVIMSKFEDGSLMEFTRSFENVASFLDYGYVRLIKKCPLSKVLGIFSRKCSGQDCQWYVIKNFTGDCAVSWIGNLKAQGQ